MIGRGSRIDVGLGLGGGRAVARRVGSQEYWSTELADGALLGNDVDALREFLTELLRQTARGGNDRDFARVPARLHIALLPPLVDTRTVELPRLTRAETERVLQRDAARFFPRAAESEVRGFGRSRAGARRSGASERTVVASASEALILTLYQAAAEASWHLERIVPAQAAWAATQDDGWIGAALPASTQVLLVAGGVPVKLRRFPPDIAAEALGAEVSAEGAGESDAPVRMIDPWQAAAAGAPLVLEPEMVPDTERAGRKTRERRRVGALATFATAAVIAAASLHAWGLARELKVLRSERSLLRPRVEQTLQARATLEALESDVASFAARDARAPRWSVVLAGLAERLPRDAHVTALVAVEDSMTLDLVAASAATAFEAVQGVEGVRSVGALAPVRREPTPAGVTVEQVELAARFEDTVRQPPSDTGEDGP